MGGLNQHLGGDALPGMGPEVTQPIRTPFLKNENWFLVRGMVIEKDSEDAGNVGLETTLRAGIVLVRVEAAGATQGKYVPADHTDAPAAASVLHAAILLKDVNMLSKDGVTVKDQSAPGVIGGWIDEDLVNFVDAAYRDDIVGALTLCYFEADPT
ncbi:MAG: hypothetical protein ACRD1X_12355 [Vicinamibacteria bacterium]